MLYLYYLCIYFVIGFEILCPSARLSVYDEIVTVSLHFVYDLDGVYHITQRKK